MSSWADIFRQAAGEVRPDLDVKEVGEPPLEGLIYHQIGSDTYNEDGTRREVPIEEADVISSQVADLPDYHKVVLDIDLPAKLVESSTPGHYHLYIDHVMHRDVYMKLLEALADARIIERGYQSASEARGYTSARLPWVKKIKAD